jgi:hypothetical protein
MRPLCQEGPSAKKFFKKLKYRLCRRPLHRTLGTSFFNKIEKTSLPTASAPDRRHRIFFQKNRKTIFADGFCSGLLAQNFQKKIKFPSLPRALSRGRRQRNFQKPLSKPPVNGYFFWSMAHCGLSAQPVPRAWCWGARQRNVVEKKFPVSPLPSTTLGKGVAKCLRPFAEK